MTGPRSKGMKTLIAALLGAIFALTGHAEEATKARLTGTWWGTVTGESSPPHSRWHWSVQRRSDGSLRYQHYLVDHEKKVYYPWGALQSWTWKLKDGQLEYFLGSVSRSDPHPVRWEDGKIRWETKFTGGGMSRVEITNVCTEEPAKKFGPQLPKDYREVTEKEFQNRYAKPEQNPLLGPELYDGGFVFPGDEPESPEK